MSQSPIPRSIAIALLAHCFATPAFAQQLKSTEIVSGLAQPIGVRVPPGDVHRLFVLERAGRIRIVKDGVLLPAPFLDIAAEVSFAGEGGMLGLAFHPDYAHNGCFFVSLVQSSDNSTVVREYHVGSNPDRADAASASAVFGPYPWLSFNHYGSDLHFGPDGKLYYSLGDPQVGLAQSLSLYEGKILRIDIDLPPPHVPIDNPFALPNDGALDLIWAFGLRNPFRFSFDRLTGSLYIGDVGEDTREEIDYQPASFGSPGSPAYQGGRNYGWSCMEGSQCTGINACMCDTSGATLVLPVFETLHNGHSSAIIGGFAYRGSAIPGLQGCYFCSDEVQCTIISFTLAQGQATNIQDRTAELNGGTSGAVTSVSSFGEDPYGELYMTCLTGKVFRIDPVAQICPAPVAYCIASPNSVGSGSQIGSTGTSSITANELVLTAAHAPHHVPGFFFYGTQTVSIPLGNGTRCVGGSLKRLPVSISDEHGFASRAFDVASTSITPGETRDFQFYYRDTAGGGALFNLSDGLSVAFCP